ncbi:uncharacterized protein LOC143186670 [Calliopsis andreniformis]|uniref:uncharacterized protein LOC143186670 n=1 Tax=Calliopsis andreniformis TaxID=337506 RepID=UPI003FCDE0BA
MIPNFAQVCLLKNIVCMSTYFSPKPNKINIPVADHIAAPEHQFDLTSSLNSNKNPLLLIKKKLLPQNIVHLLGHLTSQASSYWCIYHRKINVSETTVCFSAIEETKSKSMAVSTRRHQVFDSFLVTRGRRTFILARACTCRSGDVGVPGRSARTHGCREAEERRLLEALFR